MQIHRLSGTGDTEKKPFDWGTTLNTALGAAGAYFSFRSQQKPGSTPTTPTQTTTPQPGLSPTAKTLLFAGGVALAGILIYSLTKKK